MLKRDAILCLGYKKRVYDGNKARRREDYNKHPQSWQIKGATKTATKIEHSLMSLAGRVLRCRVYLSFIRVSPPFTWTSDLIGMRLRVHPPCRRLSFFFLRISLLGCKLHVDRPDRKISFFFVFLFFSFGFRLHDTPSL